MARKFLHSSCGVTIAVALGVLCSVLFFFFSH